VSNPETSRPKRPDSVPGFEGTTIVKWCAPCKCKTWQVDGICEWWDMHKEADNVQS